MSTIMEIYTSTPFLTGNFNGQSVKPRQTTVEEYDLMIEKGVFDEDDQVELLNGAIVEKIPKGTKHATLNDIIATHFITEFGKRVCVKDQNPIRLDEFSEPETDIVLVKPPFERYFENHPTLEDIHLILEVSDSTLGYDRNTKGEVYSRAGIIQYILLNVQEKTIEDYREPSANGFQSKKTYRAEESFNLVAFPESTFEVEDFLPKNL